MLSVSQQRVKGNKAPKRPDLLTQHDSSAHLAAPLRPHPLRLFLHLHLPPIQGGGIAARVAGKRLIVPLAHALVCLVAKPLDLFFFFDEMAFPSKNSWTVRPTERAAIVHRAASSMPSRVRCGPSLIRLARSRRAASRCLLFFSWTVRGADGSVRGSGSLTSAA